MNANKWWILNIDKQQLAETLFGTLDELLLEGTPEEDSGGHTALLNSLRTPCLPRKVDEWLSAGGETRQHSPLAWLPVELLDMVLDELLIRDVITFAITCKSLLITTKRRVLAALKPLHAPWQNGRLILREGPSDFRIFSVLWGCAGVAYPEGARVLCNISKGEYIREDTLTVARDTDATLAHALLARVSWSTRLSVTVDCSERAKEEVRHGPWAGDRFCVATMDTLPVLGRGIGPWADVTGAVDWLLRDLKEAYY